MAIIVSFMPRDRATSGAVDCLEFLMRVERDGGATTRRGAIGPHSLTAPICKQSVALLEATLPSPAPKVTTRAISRHMSFGSLSLHPGASAPDIALAVQNYFEKKPNCWVVHLENLFFCHYGRSIDFGTRCVMVPFEAFFSFRSSLSKSLHSTSRYPEKELHFSIVNIKRIDSRFIADKRLIEEWVECHQVGG